MAAWRARIDRGFGALARFIVAHRALTIVACLIPVLAATSQLPRIEIDTSTEGFLHADDPALVVYDAFRDRFGRDELIIVAFEPRAGIFDAEFLETLRAFHERIESEVPHLEDVTSLVNARATRGIDGELVVEDLMETWPESEADRVRLREWVMSNASYRDLLVSADGRLTTLIVQTSPWAEPEMDEGELLAAGFDDETPPGPSETEGEERAFLGPAENAAVVEAVQRVTDAFRSETLRIDVAGSPVVMEVIKHSMQTNMLLFIRLTLVAIAVFLFVLFRRVSAVVLPLVVVVLSLATTIGLMAATGSSLKLPTMILPSFLLAVGVGDSVHVLSLFFRAYASGEGRDRAIESALEHSGLPVVLTSLTTAGGLLSFAPTAIAPISDLGHFAPTGVIVAMLLSLVLLPALLASVPLRPPKPTGEGEEAPRHFLDDVIVAAGDLGCARPGLVVCTAALLLAVAIVGVLQIRIGHDVLKWLPPEEPTRIATERLDAALRGTVTLEIVVDHGIENALYEPDSMRALESFSRWAEDFEAGPVFFGRAFSVADIVKEINRALEDEAPAAYRLPTEREVIAQELLLFENSGADDLEDWVDGQLSMARITLKAPMLDAAAYRDVIDAVETSLEGHFGSGSGAPRIQITGIMALLFRTIIAVLESMIVSYGWAFAIITLLMIVLIGELRLGLLSMIPNLLPIVLVLGAMGYLGLPLDAFTLLVGSIAMGLAVDDTIHFMHNYRRYHDETGDSHEAVHLTLQTAGRAMLFTTLVLSAGFLIFTQASMTNIRNFGLLTASAIVLALLADFLLAPAMVELLERRRARAGG